MKTLITGGAGFIGSHISDKLFAEGHEIVIVDNLSSGFKENINQKIPLYIIDVTKRKQLERVFLKERPDYVVHAAAYTMVRDFSESNIKENIAGSINLIECCRKFDARRIVNLSTGNGLYGNPKNLPAHEGLYPAPISNYGLSKHIVELILNNYQEEYGLDFISLRLANVYGPRDNEKNDRVIPSFITRLIKNKPAIIFGKGLMKRDFVHINDVFNAVQLSLNKETEDRIFNIGSGKSISVNELFKKISYLMGSGGNPMYVEREENDEVNEIFLDIKRAREQLCWRPKLDFDEGLKETVEWYKKNIHRYSNNP